MNVKQWLEQAKKQIALADAELIAVRVFAPRGADKSWLVTHDDEKVDETRLEVANEMLRKRGEKIPLAYVFGEKEFYGRNFYVGPEVLIPRPETEALIDLVKTLELPQRPNFLEIGTGSGCVAITLALEYAQSEVVATDVSRRALDMASKNDQRHEGRVELVKSNLLDELEFDKYPEHFDVVVANLPYVNKEWDWLDLESLGHEPARALYANGRNGLSLYRRFLGDIHHYSGSDGLWMDFLVLEADPCQHTELIRMVERVGFAHLKTDGYGLLFESRWRYWFDYRTQTYVHKPKKVLEYERETWEVSLFMNQSEENWLRPNKDKKK